MDIIAGTSIYSLQDYIIDIRRVTWQGIRLDPLTHRQYRNLQIPSTTSSTPTDYIFDNIGASQIKFFPTPNTGVAALTTGLFGSNIKNCVIIEYYRTPDHSTYLIPTFFRRRLLKAYVLKQCFAIEGKGKNLKAAKYWENKWNFLKEAYGNLLEDLINQPRRIVLGKSELTLNRFMPTPVLPYDQIGIGVDRGE